MKPPARILIVEDDGVLIESLRGTLAQMSYAVVGLAASGKAAVELALAQKPDAILMDIRLRGKMSGIQAAEEIHTHLDIPIIFLTAFADESLLQQAKTTEAYAYLVKPVRDRELRASLEMALYKHTAEQRLKHLNQVLRAVRAVSQLVTREHDVQHLLDEACKILVRTRGYQFAWIGLPDGDMLKPLAQAGDDQGLIQTICAATTPEQRRELSGAALSRGAQRLVCADMLNDERYAPWKNEIKKAGFQSSIIVPILHAGSLFGVLLVYADRTILFDEEEVDLLAELADDIAFALKAIADQAERKRAEEEHSTLARLVDASPASITIYDQNGRFVYANQKTFDLHGYSREEFMRLNLHQVDDPEGEALINDRIRQIREQGEASFEVGHLRKDGSRFLLQVSTRMVESDHEAFFESIGVDITERKQVEEQLQLLKHSIDTDPDGAYWMDQEGRFLYVNNAGCKALGYTREELLQMRVFDINSDANPTKWAEFWQSLKEHKNSTIQSVHRRKDGSEFSVELTSAYLKFGGQEYCNGFARDITERLEAEERIQQSEKKYRELFQVNKDGIVIVVLSPDRMTQKFVELNHAAHNMLGYTREEMLQLDPLQLEPETTPDEFRSRQIEFETKRAASFETILAHKDGHSIYAEFTSQVIQYEGQSAIMNIVRDSTERKQREREMQTIATLSAALRTAPTRSTMLPVIVAQIVNLLSADAVTIEIVDPQTGDEITEAAVGLWASLLGSRQKKGTGINAIISQTLQPYYTADLEKDPNVFYYDWARRGIHGSAGVPLIAQEKLIGFIWIGRKTDIAQLEVRLLSAIADITANAIHRTTLFEQTQKDASDLEMAYDSTLEGWAHALELRDQETEGHTRRVVQTTILLARAMGVLETEIEHIRRGALLHDIGKMGIPDSILLKPGALSELEWQTMRRHPEYARQFLVSIDYLKPALDIPYCHHEKWDGTGYPRGLRGAEIPLAARIFAIVDVWDALTSDRPYRPAWSSQKALAYVRAQDEKHFDPKVLENFLRLIDDLDQKPATLTH